MRTRVDAATPQAHSVGTRPSAARRRPRPDRAALLALQRTAGNHAVVAALQADRPSSAPSSQASASAAWPVVQRKLNPLAAASKPGRLPDAEAESVDKLLAGNGFTLDDRKRARSDPVHLQDLQDRHDAVLQVEDKFTHGSNVDANKRRRLRVELADVYDKLIDAADRYRDDATTALATAIEAQVDLIRTQTADNKLFKGGAKIWNATAKDAITAAVLGPRLSQFTTLADFRDAVFARYNQKFKPGAVAAPTGLNAAQTLALTTEQAAIKVQLTAWKNKAYNAPGCNPNGTWGTCATGVAPWNPTHLSATVYQALAAWWRTKPGAYITPSDTATYSLKKHRDLAANDNRSATINYHVYVP